MAVRIIAAGDSFITRRLPEKGYEGVCVDFCV